MNRKIYKGWEINHSIKDNKMIYKINNFILRRKRMARYNLPNGKRNINIGCENNLIDSFVGIDGSFLIYLMKKNWIPKFIKRKIYLKTCTNNHMTLDCFLEDLESKMIIHHDINYGIPFRDFYVENIFTSHFIEHLTKEQGKVFLEECFRVLKKGGILRVICPSLNELIKEFKDDVIHYEETGNTEGVQKYLIKDISHSKYYNKFSFHKYIYNFDKLRKVLLDVGFKGVSKKSFQEGNIIHVRELDTQDGLIVEAIKT